MIPIYLRKSVVSVGVNVQSARDCVITFLLTCFSFKKNTSCGRTPVVPRRSFFVGLPVRRDSEVPCLFYTRKKDGCRKGPSRFGFVVFCSRVAAATRQETVAHTAAR